MPKVVIRHQQDRMLRIVTGEHHCVRTWLVALVRDRIEACQVKHVFLGGQHHAVQLPMLQHPQQTVEIAEAFRQDLQGKGGFMGR